MTESNNNTGSIFLFEDNSTAVSRIPKNINFGSSEREIMNYTYARLIPLIPPPDDIRRGLRYAEIGLLVASIGSNLLFFKILWSKKVLHFNIRLLCMSQILASLVFAVISILSSVHVLQPFTMNPIEFEAQLRALHNCLIQFFSFNLCAIFLERIYGTLNAKNYEHKNNYCLLFILVIFPWLSCGAIAVLALLEIFYSPIFIAIMFLLNFLCLFAFVPLLILNKKYFKQWSTKTTLSLRFQLTENIQVLKMMTAVTVFYTIHTLIGNIAYYLMYFYTVEKLLGSLHGYLRASLDAEIAFQCLIWPFVFILSHLHLRNSLRFKHQPRSKVKQVTHEDVVHFQHLTQQWNNVPIR